MSVKSTSLSASECCIIAGVCSKFNISDSVLGISPNWSTVASWDQCGSAEEEEKEERGRQWVGGDFHQNHGPRNTWGMGWHFGHSHLCPVGV